MLGTPQERTVAALETIAAELTKQTAALLEMHERRNILDLRIDDYRSLRMFITNDEAERYRKQYEQQNKPA